MHMYSTLTNYSVSLASRSSIFLSIVSNLFLLIQARFTFYRVHTKKSKQSSSSFLAPFSTYHNKILAPSHQSNAYTKSCLIEIFFLPLVVVVYLQAQNELPFRGVARISEIVQIFLGGGEGQNPQNR